MAPQKKGHTSEAAEQKVIELLNFEDADDSDEPTAEQAKPIENQLKEDDDYGSNQEVQMYSTTTSVELCSIQTAIARTSNSIGDSRHASHREEQATKHYKVVVYTSGVNVSNFSVTLQDCEQSNEQTPVTKSWLASTLFGGLGKEITINITSNVYLDDIVQVKLKLDNPPWFCRHIRVKAPSGKCFEFPCYRWLDQKEVFIREGSAQLPQDDSKFLKKQRRKDLAARKNKFGWIKSRTGFPQILDTKLDLLPLDVQFDEEKTTEFTWNFITVGMTSFLDKFRSFVQSWEKIADFEHLFRNFDMNQTHLESVKEYWNMDYLFGYQFLNGCNPVMIHKCEELPDKFPVTDEMVQSSLQRGLTLEEELQAGNIYIADYDILDGLEANKTKQNIQYYLTAPICLLYNNRLNQIVPIAIQLSQKPEERNPIFLPNENEYDWILAKMWVKSSDFNVHQLVTHLLKTHLISEVFEVVMYRNLSPVHPVYKLLAPHVRFTIAINTEARKRLISEDGVFSKISSISADGIEELMERAMKTFTYESLCFPESIKARGMENTPKYYYRDDGMKIWEAIYCFVFEVIRIYYNSDDAVLKDDEIQSFVKDVSLHGMQDNEGQKFPWFLETREALAEYLTVMIFTASAQHAAVNFGQFDWYGWIPNSPPTMRKPPKEEKNRVTMDYIMHSLPDRSCSYDVLGTVWGLSRFQDNERFLGMYPDMHFTEQPVKEAIKAFRMKLDELTEEIKQRNKGLTMPYCYLSPDQIPNSVAI